MPRFRSLRRSFSALWRFLAFSMMLMLWSVEPSSTMMISTDSPKRCPTRLSSDTCIQRDALETGTTTDRDTFIEKLQP